MWKKSICQTLFPLVYAALAVLLVAVVMSGGLWPAETNAMYPLYCGDLVYRSLGQGIWYPLYDTMWFAGAETLRWFGPLPAYLLAGCQALAGGSNLNGAYLFLGLLFFASACGWLWMGVQRDAPLLGGVLGIVWFFLPYNLHVLLVEGDLARSLAYALVPLLFFRTRAYLDGPRWTKLPEIGLYFLALILIQVQCAGMAALAWLLYLAVWRLVLHRKTEIGQLICAAIAGTLAAGLYLVPYLTGGAQGDFSETMAASFQTLVQSLNGPGYWSAPRSAVYFGLALLAVCLAAGVLGRQASVPEAWAAVALLACTTTVCYIAVRILPGSTALRGVWLFPAAAALGLLALLNWTTVCRPLAAVLVVLLAADAALPLRTLLTDGVTVSSAQRMDEVAEATLRTEAQAITAQRLAILDEDAAGAEGVYLASLWNDPVPILGGVGRERSQLHENLDQLNRALRNGCYPYVFDRCLELGCDTVLIQTDLVAAEDVSSGKLDQAAGRLGYRVAKISGSYRLYHASLGSGWGTVTDYPAIGIGSTAGATSLAYPAMKETADTNLNHYTFDQLRQYELVLLSGFTYDDKEAAEDLVLRLSEAGVHVVIAADGIPLDKHHSRSFLGVLCNNIEFSNGYPELDTIDGVLNTKLFPPDRANWSTVYVDGLDQVWGWVLDNDLRLPFYGTVKNEHIVVVGLNLHYFYSLTQDEDVETLLNHGMQLPAGRLPDRTAVPLHITYGGDTITLTTDYDNVNTALSAHDIFAGDGFRFEHHTTVIDRGTTVIHLRYPNLPAAAACSGAGVVLLGVLTLDGRRREKKARERKENP